MGRGFATGPALQNFAPPPLKRAGVKLRFLDVDSLTSEYDLGLNVRAEGDELRLVWRYSTDLFEETTVRRMAEHYERLLHGIVSDPDARLSELPLLSDDERRRIERNLHDGVQQQLVALGIDVARAKARIDADPDGARALLDDARDKVRSSIGASDLLQTWQ